MLRYSLLIHLAAASAMATAQEVPIVYERDVAPIFRAYCAGCHNDKDKEGDFSLETFAGLRRGGEEGDPIKPNDAETSLLIKLIEKRAKPSMPPADEPQVPAKEVAILKQWLAQGAKGPAKDESILSQLVVPQHKASAAPRPITSIALSPGGIWSAVARGREVEVRIGEAVHHVLPRVKGQVNAVSFSPDGGQIVVASGITGLSGVATLFDAASGSKIKEFKGSRDTLYAAQYSPNGRFLATAGYDRVIRLWNLSTSQLEREIPGHTGAIFALAWHPEGKVLASASADSTVKLWRVSDGLRLDTLNQPQGEQNACLFTPDGSHIVSVGTDKRLHLWRFISRDAPGLNPVVLSRFAHESPIIALSMSRDGSWLATSAEDRVAKIWSLPDLTEKLALPASVDLTSALAIVPERPELMLGGMDGSLRRIPINVSPQQPEATSAKAPPALVSQGQSVSSVATESPQPLQEIEPNDTPRTSASSLKSFITTGAISRPEDVDLFPFEATAGESIYLEINAARSQSKLDSRLQILDHEGQPVEQVILQAVRDSWFTFRGKDSFTSDDFRLHNWREMELNEFLYCNGEVVKLWLYPRGPDSGFRVYPGVGNRQTYFHTSPLSHALGEPCYIVRALPPGSSIVPNGLPMMRLAYENDDDSSLQAGKDSVILFTAPKSGLYWAKVSDVRGFGAEKDFHYTLNVRPPQPRFSVRLDGLNPKVSAGSGKEITLTATRFEGFDGPIEVSVDNLPAGFNSNSPLLIEAGQPQAFLLLSASPEAIAPDETADKAVKVVARANVGGKAVEQELGTLGDLQIGPAAKVLIEVLSEKGEASPSFVIKRGQTITALVRAARKDFKGRIELGGDDSGRNMPHGVFVDNIGLNGLLIVEDQSERTFSITASPVANLGERLFHLTARVDGSQSSKPVRLRVIE